MPGLLFALREPVKKSPPSYGPLIQTGDGVSRTQQSMENTITHTPKLQIGDDAELVLTDYMKPLIVRIIAIHLYPNTIKYDILIPCSIKNGITETSRVYNIDSPYLFKYVPGQTQG